MWFNYLATQTWPRYHEDVVCTKNEAVQKIPSEQTDIQADIQTDRQTWLKLLPTAYAAGNNIDHDESRIFLSSFIVSLFA